MIKENKSEEKNEQNLEVVKHDENAMFSLAIDIVAGFQINENELICRKIKRQGKIIH